jgi:ubiquinone biosynthesis protein COQ9
MRMVMQMKLKSFGKGKNKMQLKKIRYEILQDIKKHVVKNGWSEDIFLDLENNHKFTYDEIKSLFPNGYKSILEIYLKEINLKMALEAKKINLIRLRVHERIRELIILRLNIMAREKNLITKTFFTLTLPNNYKLSIKNLYNTIDEIWFLAGDNSTDFNYYSKRAILASIYTTVMIHFTNNKDINSTYDLLNKQLKKVSKIPKIKNRIKDISKIFPYIIKLKNNFSSFKQ